MTWKMLSDSTSIWEKNRPQQSPSICYSLNTYIPEHAIKVFTLLFCLLLKKILDLLWLNNLTYLKIVAYRPRLNRLLFVLTWGTFGCYLSLYINIITSFWLSCMDYNRGIKHRRYPEMLSWAMINDRGQQWFLRFPAEHSPPQAQICLPSCFAFPYLQF